MTIEAYVHGFGCMPTPTGYDAARAVVIPVPLDWGQSEQAGVALGPMSILGASRFIETFDAELSVDPLELGVATLDALDLDYGSEEGPLNVARGAIEAVLRDGKFPLCLGGERTIALAGARASRAVHGEVGVVLFSRRAGMLETSAGRRISPRTIGRRLAEEGPLLLLGARSWSAREAAALAAPGAPTLLSARTIETTGSLRDAHFEGLPTKVYLSIDLGVLDPAFLPMAGNIEPGGLGWFSLTALIDKVFERFEVIGCDVAGLVPTVGQIAPAMLGAQLAIRCLGRALTSQVAPR